MNKTAIFIALAFGSVACISNEQGTTYSGSNTNRAIEGWITWIAPDVSIEIQVLEDQNASSETWTTIGTVVTPAESNGTWPYDQTALYHVQYSVTPVTGASDAARWPEGGLARLRMRSGTIGPIVFDDLNCANDQQNTATFIDAISGCATHDSYNGFTVVDIDDASGEVPNPAVEFLTYKTTNVNDTDDYYKAVGALNSNGTPSAARGTFTAWAATNGFPAGELHATYYNTGDLGFGRDMHCRNTNYGVACYVTNYGTIEDGLADLADGSALNDAVAGVNSGATVAMEYHQAAAANNNPVRFFVYDTFDNGTDGLISELSLDSSTQAKAVPGICMACHGGTFNNGSDGSTARVEGAEFLPFDIDAFDYHSTRTKADQADTLRALNLMVRGTLVSTNPSYELISGWYPTPISDFNESFVPSGWQNNDAARTLYQKVYRPYCQVCHNSQAYAPTTYDGFVSFKSSIQSASCGNALRMPHAEVTFDQFWQSDARAYLTRILEIKDDCDGQ